MKILYFHSQYKADGLGNNKMSYNIFDLRLREQSSCTLSEEKQNVHIFIQVSRRREWKNIKKRGCRAVFKVLLNIYDGAFLRKCNDKKLHHRCLIWF